jgi:hypothetical protein
MANRTIRIGVGLLLIGGAAGIFGAIVMSPRKYQWDFATYYYSALAYSRGQSPYDAEVATGAPGGPVHIKFVYPPHVLPVFAWTAGVPYDQASLAWLIAKGIFLLALLLLWRKMLIREEPGVEFFAFAAVAFNAAILIDLTAGNVAIIEQALLWGGFLAFTRKRWLLFALLTGASSFFKVTNGLCLLLLFISPGRARAIPIAAGALAILAPLAVSFLSWPSLFGDFLTNARGLMEPGERGSTNPCLWACIEDARDILSSITGREIPPAAAGALFAAHGIAIVTATGLLLKKLGRTVWEDRFLFAVCLVCLAFPLVVPRFKDYSYIQLIPPAFLLLRRAGSGTFGTALIAFIVCAPTATAFRILTPLTTYHLLFVDYGLWVLMYVFMKSKIAELEGIPPVDALPA